MTQRKSNPRKPRRNAKGQYTKPRRRPEDAQTKSEMVGYETQPPRVPDEPRKTMASPSRDEHVGYETSAPRDDALGMRPPRNPIPPEDRWTWKVEPGGSGLKINSAPANWEPPRAVVEGRYTLRSMFAVWRRWLRSQS